MMPLTNCNDQPKKILIIKWSALGDCVIASSIFDDIYRAFPQAQVHLNILEPWHLLFQHDPRIYKIIHFPMRKVGINTYIKWLKFIKQEKYDLIIDLQSNDKTCFLLGLIKCLGFAAPLQIGVRQSFAFKYAPDISAREQHVINRYRSVLLKIGIKLADNLLPKLFTSPIELEHVNEQTKSLGRFILFYPGCSPKAKAKQWPYQYYSELALLIKQKNLADHIVLIGAKDEKLICQNIAASDPNFIINKCEQTSLLELSIWAKNAIANIGNDTGAAHIAASANKPQITFFGPTSEVKSSPLNQHNINMTYNIDCRPCFNNLCQLQHHHCMKLISPTKVLQTLEQQLNAYYSNSTKHD